MSLVTALSPIAPQSTFVTHRVTLVNYAIDKRIELEVVTSGERFSEVCREVSRLRDLYNLRGYALDWESPIEVVAPAPF